MADIALAIDLGGTAVKAGLIDRERQLLANLSSPTGPDFSAQAVSVKIAEMILDLNGRAVHSGHVVKGVGVGVPGGVYEDCARVSQAPNFPEWRDVNLREILEEKVPFPVTLDNDANVAALGESWAGEGQDANSLVLLTLGTGIGSGIILDKKIWRGAWGMAGELGHITITPDGPLCGCGNRGCLEAMTQKDAIIRLARSKVVRGLAPKLADLIAGDFTKITPKLIFEAAKDGCEGSREVYREIGRIIGIASASLLNILNMELILIGGGISGAFEFLVPSIREEIFLRAFRIPAEHVSVRRAKLGNDAGLFGAAKIVFDRFA